ncbi:MAG: hypothetical protein NTX61_15145 [Bacteroidetes bacterium]|nr:hypothetical protein [Bacteroidota bacterium]
MIERYFCKGIRVKWNCPKAYVGGAMDGSIINDPVQVRAPMLYDGIDPALGLTLPHVSTMGLNIGMPINFAWLNYVHGHTSRRLLSAGDVLTGPMSGCLIAEWTDRGMRWVGHVGTVVGSDAINKKVKQQIGIALPTQARGFYPDKEWGGADIPPLQSQIQSFDKFARFEIFALVTTTCDFYSILMFHLGGDKWCVGGCKKVAAKNALELRGTLLA